MDEKVEFYKETEFRDTEIGRIPKDWEVIKLGNVITYVKGKKPKGMTEEHQREYFPYLSAEYLRNNKVTKFVEPSQDVVLVNEGDLILLWDGSNAGEFFWGKQGILSSTMVRIEQKKPSYDQKFLFYLLKAKESFLKGQTKGTGIPHVNENVLNNLIIPDPPLVEQQKIAEILSTVDEAIQKTDDIIAKTERLKKGLIQELLKRGIGHKEFKFSKELDCEIPKEWSVVKLREIGENKDSIVAGPFGSNLKVKDYTTEGVPIIRLQNIERNKFIDENIKYTSPEKAKELSYHSFQPGDLVLAKLGDPIGKTCIVPSSIGKGIVVADVVRIRLSPKKVINKFIEYMLNSNICYEQLRKEIIGTTRPRTNITQIRNLKLPLPSFQEQQKIAEILSTVDEKLETSKLEKARLERIKQWFMGELLSGRIRVRVA
jgi:type I restriction enzyme S subunit